jgi:monofunctional biosynthetic peptidoglycan transglycosylase
MIAEPSAARPRRLVRGALAALLLLAAAPAALWLTLPDPAAWSRSVPTTTALIEQRQAEARAAGRRYQPAIRWIPLERISRRLVDAVVAAEDAKFFVHGGFDWSALGDAFRHDVARGRYARGASTITQQLAKNLYLGTEKSLLRKAREALLTVKLERSLDKRRILALYLNVAEWGDGVFGAGPGARRYFGTDAGSLTTAQAVLLASMLPSPRRASLSPAPAWLAARSRGLLERLVAEQVIPPGEYATAQDELRRYLGPPPAAGPAEEEIEPPPDDAPAEPPADLPGEPVPASADPPMAEPPPAEPSSAEPVPAEPVPIEPLPPVPGAPADRVEPAPAATPASP